jgi:hypothetical protein
LLALPSWQALPNSGSTNLDLCWPFIRVRRSWNTKSLRRHSAKELLSNHQTETGGEEERAEVVDGERCELGCEEELLMKKKEQEERRGEKKGKNEKNPAVKNPVVKNPAKRLVSFRVVF